MKKRLVKTILRDRRHKRIRARVSGTATRPRLSVYRSNKYMYAQLIDDDKGVTLAHATSLGVKGKSMMEKAKQVGIAIAESAKAKKIKDAVFDRGGFIYTGRVKAIADGAREAGLKF